MRVKLTSHSQTHAWTWAAGPAGPARLVWGKLAEDLSLPVLASVTVALTFGHPWLAAGAGALLSSAVVQLARNRRRLLDGGRMLAGADAGAWVARLLVVAGLAFLLALSWLTAVELAAGRSLGVSAGRTTFFSGTGSEAATPAPDAAAPRAPAERSPSSPASSTRGGHVRITREFPRGPSPLSGEPFGTAPRPQERGR